MKTANLKQLTDEQLVTAVAEHDQVALETLYDRYAALVMGLALRVTQERGLAEEIVQETFWRVWQHADSFQAQRGSFATWLFSIARRLAIDGLRRRKVRPQPTQSDGEERQMNAVPDPEGDVGDAAWLSIRGQQVRTAVSALPPEQFQVIELAYFQGLTRQEIARLTGDPLGTIHTRARLALQKLRDALHSEGMSE